MAVLDKDTVRRTGNATDIVFAFDSHIGMTIFDRTDFIHATGNTSDTAKIVPTDNSSVNCTTFDVT